MNEISAYVSGASTVNIDPSHNISQGSWQRTKAALASLRRKGFDTRTSMFTQLLGLDVTSQQHLASRLTFIASAVRGSFATGNRSRVLALQHHAN